MKVSHVDGWQVVQCHCAMLLCRLSVSDTLSGDEEETDQETEELRRQFVQELILSTLCLSEEKSDSDAT